MLEGRLTKCHAAGFKFARHWALNDKGKKVNPILIPVCKDCGRMASLTEKTRAAYEPDIMPTFFKMLWGKIKGLFR